MKFIFDNFGVKEQFKFEKSDVEVDPRVVRACDAWKQSFVHLKAALAEFPSLDLPDLSEDSLEIAMARAENTSLDHTSSYVFGNIIEQVLTDQEAKSNQLSSKIGSFMTKVYPVAKVILQVVAFSADVGIPTLDRFYLHYFKAASFLPLKVTANGLIQVVSVSLC